MSRSITIAAICDSCAVRGDEIDFAMDQVINIPGLHKKPKMIDLCTLSVEGGQNCIDDFHKAMSQWMDIGRNADVAARPVAASRSASRGATPSTAASRLIPGEEVLTCEVPGCIRGSGKTPFVTNSATGLRRHQTRTHDAEPTPETKRRRQKRAAAR